MTEKKRVNLYDRLPEIYRIKDEDIPELYLYDKEPAEAFQLRSYLEPVEDMFSEIHENIESLYHDFFIETCDDWVIPYIADLLGTSHLSGDPWTLRADVADTIALRRRKGTLGAIELLTYILSKWGVHCAELRENLVWNQHLNHQRPDEGGIPPYSLPKVKMESAIRGGTMNLRDPSLLSLLNTPFDPFAHIADVRPAEIGQIRYNLPNLAIFLWRIRDFRLDVIKPFTEQTTQVGDAAPFVVRVNVNPIPVNNLSTPYVKAENEPAGQPIQLFNTNRFDLFNLKREETDKLNLSALPPRISSLDQVPAPIPVERISDYEIADKYDDSLDSPIPQLFETFAEASFTAPHEYIQVKSYDENDKKLTNLEISDVGFQLHIPRTEFPNEIWLHRKSPRFWTIRGENLCGWEKNLHPPLKDREIAIDPIHGRVVIGVSNQGRADALESDLLLTTTYGAVGEVGAHPISYPDLPKELNKKLTQAINYFEVNFREDEEGLRKALEGISTRNDATVIEITDSRTHLLDLSAAQLAADVEDENGIFSLKLNAPLVIRAADNQRPIIELVLPLAFRPVNIVGADEEEQKDFDAVTEKLSVRLEGIYLARGLDFPADEPLISRAAINSLDILNCTLDPGGFKKFDDTRSSHFLSINLKEPYGFDDVDEEREFKQTPEITIQRSICGAVLLDSGYRLCLTDSIIDAGQGVNNQAEAFAISNATDPNNGYAAPILAKGVTILGKTRVESIEGSGVIFVHSLVVQNQQIGCLKYSYFADEAENQMPQNHACVKGDDAKLFFTSEIFGEAAFGQVSLQSDRRILEEGPNSDQMGAFGFLLEAHKWRNLQIRFREFMPVDVRPILIPVT